MIGGNIVSEGIVIECIKICVQRDGRCVTHDSVLGLNMDVVL